jgi:hypothetical protein
MSDQKTAACTLSEPIVYNEKTYAVLGLRKLKAKDLVAGDLVQGETRKGFAILASMANVPIGVIEELEIDDLARLNEVAAPLMGKSLAAAADAAKGEEKAAAQ